MRRFFQPADGPTWLGQMLTSIRSALGDIWDHPIRLFSTATADLPPAADYSGGIQWNSTSGIITWSNGTSWLQPSLSTHVHAAADVTFSPAGNIAATDVQAAIVELDTEKLAASSYTAADVLAKLLTVDGAGSGLDADTLDGTAPTAFGLSLLDDADPATARATLELGTAATQNTGTSGANVPLLNGNNTYSGQHIVTGAARFSGGSAGLTGGNALELSYVNVASYGSVLYSVDRTSGATNRDMRIIASTIRLAAGTGDGTVIGTVSTTGIAVTGNISASGKISQTGATGASNALNTNTGNNSSTTAVNPGVVVYYDGTNYYGMDLGYNGASYRTRISAPATVAIAMSATTPTGPGSFTEVAQFTSTGLNVVGLVQCDTFRIDATPTAAAVAQTHHVPISINGVTYKLLLAS